MLRKSIAVLLFLLNLFHRHSTKKISKKVVLPRHPLPDDHEAYRAYWKTQGQSWRLEPEIDSIRKAFLADRRVISPNIKYSIYPFKDIRLGRADVEWLLATHENGIGPVNWDNEDQRDRSGIDLRGAYMMGVDLSGLPLACTRGGLDRKEQSITNEMQQECAAVHLEGANLSDAHLEGSQLARAHLEGVDLHRVHLQHTNLFSAHLEGANLRTAHLESVYLAAAYLNGKVMEDLELKRIREWKSEFPKMLHPANLRYAFLNSTTNLTKTHLGDRHHGFISVVDVRWSDVNLAVVRWGQIVMLGEEYKARQKMEDGRMKEIDTRLEEYETAVRANRQLAVVLQMQGLNEVSARFAYRAQTLQKKVFWFLMFQHKGNFREQLQLLRAWLFTWFLFLIAGYGYKPSRSFLAYLFVISGFATIYYLLGHIAGPSLSPLGAFVFSMTSFHGRGFFPGNNIQLDNPLTVLAALEALIGLIIEVTFIATLTQLFFRR